MCRTILLAFALLALTAFASASAAPAPAPGGCPPSLDLLAPVTATPVCAAAATPAPTPRPTFMTTATVYHGFCRCTCSKIPDCNTNADCSNGRCLGGISCC
jgi:hypothetical protein